MTNMLKLNQICKLNEDTMASYESQLTKEKVKETNVFSSMEKSNLRYYSAAARLVKMSMVD